MPVTCMNKDGEKLISIDYTEDDWKLLKANYSELGLYMRCCNSPAIPKSSKLRTQFFAHKSDACGSGGESIDHLRCKELVILGARSAGWFAEPEESGVDNKGNTWIADVLCSNGGTKVAFEVQLASQTFDDYKHRTERYVNSGVRCLWFLRRTKRGHAIVEQMILDRIQSKNRNDVIGHHPDRQDMPVFQVDVSDLDNIFVFFPRHHGRGPYELPLDGFVDGVLSGNLVFEDKRWCWNA